MRVKELKFLYGHKFLRDFPFVTFFSRPEIKLKSAQITISKVRRQLQIFCVDVHLAYERRHNKSALEVCFH